MTFHLYPNISDVINGIITLNCILSMSKEYYIITSRLVVTEHVVRILIGLTVNVYHHFEN